MAIGETINGDDHYLLLTAVITIGFQLVFFAIAFTFKFDKVTDFAGGLNFALLGLLTLGLGDTYYTRQCILTALLVASRLYLAIFLLIRVLQRGSDNRFDEIRTKFFTFLGFWVFQMVWVWVVSLPVVFVNGDAHNPDLSAADYVGWALWVIGFYLQVSADLTKMQFKKTARSGDFCNHGVWAVSRHPNYCGEIFMWWGIFISATRVFGTGDDDWGWVTILSPILTMVLLLFASGIPTAEGQAQGRYMKTPEDKRRYEAYRTQTPPLFPFLPALYKGMPMGLKRLLCFELPMYEYDETKARINGSDQPQPTADAPQGNSNTNDLLPQHATTMHTV
eukprot:m.28431 g.28431  ORF g.28431 m.28431 type:complete len:335 (+) comp11836_c0_seq1:172-1176(+)